MNDSLFNQQLGYDQQNMYNQQGVYPQQMGYDQQMFGQQGQSMFNQPMYGQQGQQMFGQQVQPMFNQQGQQMFGQQMNYGQQMGYGYNQQGQQMFGQQMDYGQQMSYGYNQKPIKYSRMQIINGMRDFVLARTGVCVSKEQKIEDCPDLLRHACVEVGDISQLQRNNFDIPEMGLSIPIYFCTACGKLYYYKDFM